MPTEQILSEEAVREIEAHFHLTTDGDAVFVLSRAPALCATVRAPQGQYDSAVSDFAAEINHVNQSLSEVTKERDDLKDELIKTKQHRNDLIEEVEVLRSQRT